MIFKPSSQINNYIYIGVYLLLVGVLIYNNGVLLMLFPLLFLSGTLYVLLLNGNNIIEITDQALLVHNRFKLRDKCREYWLTDIAKTEIYFAGRGYFMAIYLKNDKKKALSVDRIGWENRKQLIEYLQEKGVDAQFVAKRR